MQDELALLESALRENDVEKLEWLLENAQDKYRKFIQPS
jgi:hypothetical protein